jgi:acyl-coenzyme A thioesterase PaaI-like protein
MRSREDPSLEIMTLLRQRLGDRIDAFAIPPPVFEAMQGEFIAFNREEESLIAQFPILERYLNPYAAMQGGMIAAAVDNTLGPLSVLVAPPNMTRKLEMIYSRPVTLDMGVIVVKAKLLKREEQKLTFSADVRSRDGNRLARAKAVHWILDQAFPGSRKEVTPT